MDFSGLLATVDGGYSDVLDTWPDSLRAQLLRLAKRVWPADERLVESPLHCFTHLTRLYPFLQADGVATCTQRQIENALVAHACFVLHAYIADKVEDGQIGFDSDDARVLNRLYGDGTKLLGRLKSVGHSPHDLRTVFSDVEPHRIATDVGEDEFRMINAADLSARPGFFATLSLLAYAGRPRNTLQCAARAYRHTVLALQYIDDMLDWREDMRIGDNNLLLGAVADRGLQAPEPSANEWDHLNVAHTLLRFDAIRVAAGRARAHLYEAIALQRDMGCNLLQDRLASLVCEVDTLAPELHRRLENEVLVGFLISSAAARQSRR